MTEERLKEIEDGTCNCSICKIIKECTEEIRRCQSWNKGYLNRILELERKNEVLQQALEIAADYAKRLDKT